MEGSRNLILLSDHHGPSPAATPVCSVLLQFVSSSPSGAWEPRLRSVPRRSVLGERSEVTWVRMAAYPLSPSRIYSGRLRSLWSSSRVSAGDTSEQEIVSGPSALGGYQSNLKSHANFVNLGLLPRERLPIFPQRL